MAVRALDDYQHSSDNHAVGTLALYRRNVARLLVLGCVSTFFGCAGTSTGPQSSTPGGDPPTLNFSVTAVNFGSISLGTNKTSSMVLSNSSTSTVSISVTNVSVSGSAFSLSSPPTFPATLSAGQSLTLTVAFTPSTSGTATGTVTITSNASNASASVALSGSGLAVGQLAVNPSTLSFGNVAVGSSSSKSASLTAGTSSVTVSTASWNGQGYSVSGINFPVTVAAGQSVSFNVDFAPSAAGSSSGTISFISDAGNSPTTETLSGTGTQASAHSVDLSWNASSSVIVGYNIYRGTQSGGPYTKVNSAPEATTSFSDGTVASGTTYYYVTTAVDGQSVESIYSNEVQAVIPNP